MKFRVPARMADHMLESNAAHNPEGEDADTLAIVAALRAAKRRRDGSTHIDMDTELQQCMREFAEALRDGAADNLGDIDETRDALADFNAASAMLRALNRAAETD